MAAAPRNVYRNNNNPMADLIASEQLVGSLRSKAKNRSEDDAISQ